MTVFRYGHILTLLQAQALSRRFISDIAILEYVLDDLDKVLETGRWLGRNHRIQRVHTSGTRTIHDDKPSLPIEGPGRVRRNRVQLIFTGGQGGTSITELPAIPLLAS
jgi:hypothetical protein